MGVDRESDPVAVIVQITAGEVRDTGSFEPEPQDQRPCDSQRQGQGQGQGQPGVVEAAVQVSSAFLLVEEAQRSVLGFAGQGDAADQAARCGPADECVDVCSGRVAV